jgi:phospholipid/cholesterol/gamma-HCH transport system substrate-binding protein
MSPRWTFAGHVLTVAIFTGLAVALSAFILSASHTTPFGSGGYRLHVVVPASALLTEGSHVTMGGASVGYVSKIDRQPNGQRGVQLELHITDHRVIPVPVDSRVQLRTRTQVGENYVSVTVGRSPQTFQSDAYMPASSSDELVDVDQILSVLNGSKKTRARQLLQSLGGALDGRGDQLSQTLQATDGLVSNGYNLVQTLDKQKRTTAQLVDQLGQVTADVGARGQAIDTIAHRGLVAVHALGNRDRELSDIFRLLPSTLAAIRSTSDTIGRVTGQATPVVDNLTAAAHDLAPAIRALAPAARSGREVVESLGAAAPKLRSTLRQATALSKPLAHAIPQLRSALCQVNPMLRYLEPYSKDFLYLLVGLGSASNSYDAVGHLIRLAPIINDNTESGLPPLINAARSALLDSGLFLKSKAVDWDPYMKPGQLGSSAAYSNKPGNPTELKNSGFTYTRVTADC